MHGQNHIKFLWGIDFTQTGPWVHPL